jgi:hypothetical protein
MTKATLIDIVPVCAAHMAVVAFLGPPSPEGSLGHLERLMEPREVLRWTETRSEDNVQDLSHIAGRGGSFQDS